MFLYIVAMSVYLPLYTSVGIGVADADAVGEADIYCVLFSWEVFYEVFYMNDSDGHSIPIKNMQIWFVSVLPMRK